MFGPGSLLILLSMVLSGDVVSAASPENGKPPNIVLVYADDLGWRDTGHTGSDFYQTPHIDRLASRGMTFSDAYAAAAVCAPSRAALLSGQYPGRLGYYGMLDWLAPRQAMRVQPVTGDAIYRTDDLTVADALRAQGYTTGMIGKWQLGNSGPRSPAERGFTFVYETTNPKPPRPESSDGPKRIDELDRVTAEFLRENREKPFFLYVSHHAVHYPVVASRKKIQKYTARKPGVHHRDPVYAALIETLDESVGKLMAGLRDNGLVENTVVIFTSDNGATDRSSQSPLQGTKGTFYEGGIRVPLFISWPEHIPAGSTTSTPVSQIDLYPTLLQLAGASVPEGKILDGISLVPLLTRQRPPTPRALFWHLPRYRRPKSKNPADGFRTTPVSVVREENWKLFLFHDRWALDGGRNELATNRAVALFDLKADPGESHDLATSNPTKRDELLDLLLAWIDATGAAMAHQPNPDYQPPQGSRQGRTVDEGK